MALLSEDLRFAARLLRRSPGFTLMAVLSLGLAIGANTVIFSVVNRVLLRPLPFQEPDRLFWVVRHDGVRDTAPLSAPQWLDAGELQALRVKEVRLALRVLMGSVGLVLLIACVNLANLQLARITDRERELAVRIALGARPSRIARQLLTESILLAFLGGALGLVLAAWALPVLLALAPAELALPQRLQLDGAALVFTPGVSLLAGLLFGLLPAWQASRMDPRHSLHVRARRRILRFSGGYTRWLLLMGQVALAVILLVGAMLLVKSFVILRAVPPGFDAPGVWTMKLPVPQTRYESLEAFEVLSRRIMERVRSLPGVQAVGFALTVPLETGFRLDITLEGERPEESGTSASTPPQYRPVTRGYFEALKIDLLRGRLLDDLDQHGSPPVAVINEAAARLYWPGQDPRGRRITLAPSIPQYTDAEPREIIGVVSDVHELALQEVSTPVVYVPLGQMPEPLYARFVDLMPQNLLIRTSGESGPLMAAVQREIWAVDPAQPVMGAVSMEEIISRRLRPQRFSTVLLGLMAGLALVLATVGIYGVRTYLENQRAREIAVRLALGATPGAVVWLVVRQGMSAVGVGVVLGLLGAARLTRLIEHLLFGVSPVDPAVFLFAPAVLMGVALVATWLPAWRASRVDPMVSLRAD